MGLDFLKGSGKDWLKEASGFNDWWSDIRADLKRPFEDQDPLLDEEFPSSVADLSLLDLEPDEDLDVCLLSIKKFKFRADVAPKLPLDESLLKLKLPCEIDILGLPIPAITGRLRFPVGDIPSGLGDFDDDVQWDVGVFQEITFGGKDR